jgi:hypothetical protein
MELPLSVALSRNGSAKSKLRSPLKFHQLGKPLQDQTHAQKSMFLSDGLGKYQGDLKGTGKEKSFHT